MKDTHTSRNIHQKALKHCLSPMKSATVDHLLLIRRVLGLNSAVGHPDDIIPEILLSHPLPTLSRPEPKVAEDYKYIST